jgi:four helix bundle protein
MSVSYTSGNRDAGGLPHAFGFRDLVVYQKARALQKAVFELSKTFPKEETYSLTDQIRRCSRSVGAQIAEAWAKRRYEAHFISKLTDGVGENYETEHWLDTSLECGYATPESTAELISIANEVGRMLGAMIQKSAQFCGGTSDRLREGGDETTGFFSPYPG